MGFNNLLANIKPQARVPLSPVLAFARAIKSVKDLAAIGQSNTWSCVSDCYDQALSPGFRKGNMHLTLVARKT